MKTLLLHACAFLVLSLPVAAEIIGVEQFDYSDGAIAGQNGGTFWDWQNRLTPAPGPRHTGTPSNWNGTPSVGSGRLVTNNSSARREYNGPGEGPGANIETDEGFGAINNFSNGTISFQQHALYYRVTFSTGATLPSFVSINSSDFGTDRVGFGASLDVANDNKFSIKEYSTNSVSDSGTLLTANTTYTLVAKLNFVAGTATLYLNPDLNAAESSQTILRGPLPFNTANWSTSVRLASGTGGSVTWDDLVVATTWDELGTVVTTTADEDDGSLLPTANGGSGGTGVSLREAVKYSPSGTLITFDPALNGQTCTLSTSNEIVVTKNLTLDASSLSAGLTIDGGAGTNRIFTVNSGQSLTLRSLTLTGGNGAGAMKTGNGGAIFNNDGTLTLTECTLYGNSAAYGGAIFFNFGSLTLTQCTFSGNSAQSFGGAIYNGDTLKLTQCTLSGNSALDGGGAIFNESTLTLTHSIVAGNRAINGPDVSVASGATVTATGVNLLGNLAGSGLSAGPTVIVGDAKLSPLGYFGGPTQTMHPLVGSPAIDAGGTTDPGGTDQRGFPRFVDGDGDGTAKLDIGAVEAWPHARSLFVPDHPVTTAVDEDDGSILAGFGTGTSLREAVKYAPLNAPNGFVITFAPSMSGKTITLNGSEIPLNNNVFIDASNLTAPVTISGNNASRVFNIAAGAIVAVQRVNVTDAFTNDPFGGGGIRNQGSLILIECTLTRNSSVTGGGIRNDGTVTLIESVLSGNSGSNSGGGLYNQGTATLTRSTLAENQASQLGGGIWSNFGTLTLNQSTVSGNSGASGGGIATTDGPATLNQCTISGNPARTYGGGIYQSNSAVVVNQCTISGNSAGFDGGALKKFGNAPTEITNSITTGNMPDDINGGFTGAGNLTSGDARLAPLGDYGGPTQTMALLPGSPALGAALNSTATTDQRGFPIVGTADLGAYESQGSTVSLSSSNNPALPGESATITATVNKQDPRTITPTGTVTFTVDSVVGSPVTLKNNGIATLTLSALTLGSHTITASYSGDANLLASTSSAFTQPVIDLNNIDTSDSGTFSLRQALANAAAHPGPDTITLPNSLNGQTLTLSSVLAINDAAGVTIDATGLSNGFTIDGGNAVQLFNVSSGSKLTLKGVTLNHGGNSSLSYGGAFRCNGALTLTGCTLTNCRALYFGGAIMIESSGSLSMTGCTLTGNQAGNGGAISSSGSSLTLTDCTLSENTALTSGLTNGDGGAISSGSALATLTNCTLSGNTAGGSGGALNNGNALSTLKLISCTFSGNTAGNKGDAIYNASPATVTHCTVAGNASSHGALYQFKKSLTLTNSIVAGNTTTGGKDIINDGGQVIRVSTNIVQSQSNVNAGTDSGPAAINTDPVLQPLGNYGGLTQTMPPQPSSPAIDQASVLVPALTSDQRGLPRPLGIRPDIGAVEGSVIVVTTPVDELDAPGALGAGVSLREAVRDITAGGTIVFDRAVFNSLTTNTIMLTKGPLNAQHNCTLNGSLNPGGITILNTLTITAQPVPLSVASTAAANFAVVVTNVSGGVAYQWRKDGSDIGGKTNTALALNNVTENDEALYDVTLSEAPTTGTLTLNNVNLTPASTRSQPASLIVDGALVTVKRGPSSAMLALGSNYTLSVNAIGPATPALTYQWTKAGKNIAGATKSSFIITNAQLAHAGAYTCVVKSGTLSPGVTSTTAEIGVVDARPKTVNLLAAATTSFTPTVSAAGNGLQPFVWKRDSTVLASTTKAFPIKPVAVSDAGLYTCTVTGLAGTITTGFNTLLNVSNALPALMTPLTLPPTTIGQAYYYQIPVVSTAGAPATSFSLTGALPSGMTFNTTTGILSGRPTVTKATGYALSFRAINAKGSGPAAPATLTVNVVPTTAVGIFAGPIARSSLNDNLGGRFDLTTTATGLCSGSITLGARTKIPFTNQLLLSAGTGDVILRANIPNITLADKTVLTAYVEVFAADQRAVLTLVHPTLGTTLIATAWRNPWLISKTAALNKPATAFAAYYTVRLDTGTAAS